MRHIGRTSGRAYSTPAGARVHGDVVVIPLTFGNQSDWAKNVRAADGCSPRVNGEEYTAVAPEFVDRRDAGPLLKSAFGPVERAGFRLLGIRQYLRLRVAGVDQAAVPVPAPSHRHDHQRAPGSPGSRVGADRGLA